MRRWLRCHEDPAQVLSSPSDDGRTKRLGWARSLVYVLYQKHDLHGILQHGFHHLPHSVSQFVPVGRGRAHGARVGASGLASGVLASGLYAGVCVRALTGGTFERVLELDELANDLGVLMDEH